MTDAKINPLRAAFLQKIAGDDSTITHDEAKAQLEGAAAGRDLRVKEAVFRAEAEKAGLDKPTIDKLVGLARDKSAAPFLVAPHTTQVTRGGAPAKSAEAKDPALSAQLAELAKDELYPQASVMLSELRDPALAGKVAGGAMTDSDQGRKLLDGLNPALLQDPGFALALLHSGDKALTAVGDAMLAGGPTALHLAVGLLSTKERELTPEQREAFVVVADKQLTAMDASEMALYITELARVNPEVAELIFGGPRDPNAKAATGPAVDPAAVAQHIEAMDALLAPLKGAEITAPFPTALAELGVNLGTAPGEGYMGDVREGTPAIEGRRVMGVEGPARAAIISLAEQGKLVEAMERWGVFQIALGDSDGTVAALITPIAGAGKAPAISVATYGEGGRIAGTVAASEAEAVDALRGQLGAASLSSLLGMQSFKDVLKTQHPEEFARKIVDDAFSPNWGADALWGAKAGDPASAEMQKHMAALGKLGELGYVVVERGAAHEGGKAEAHLWGVMPRAHYDRIFPEGHKHDIDGGPGHGTPWELEEASRYLKDVLGYTYDAETRQWALGERPYDGKLGELLLTEGPEKLSTFTDGYGDRYVRIGEPAAKQYFKDTGSGFEPQGGGAAIGIDQLAALAKGAAAAQPKSDVDPTAQPKSNTDAAAAAAPKRKAGGAKAATQKLPDGPLFQSVSPGWRAWASSGDNLARTLGRVTGMPLAEAKAAIANEPRRDALLAVIAGANPNKNLEQIIADMQRELVPYGYPADGVDGKDGPKTATAYKNAVAAWSGASDRDLQLPAARGAWSGLDAAQKREIAIVQNLAGLRERLGMSEAAAGIKAEGGTIPERIKALQSGLKVGATGAWDTKTQQAATATIDRAAGRLVVTAEAPLGSTEAYAGFIGAIEEMRKKDPSGWQTAMVELAGNAGVELRDAVERNLGPEMTAALAADPTLENRLLREMARGNDQGASDGVIMLRDMQSAAATMARGFRSAFLGDPARYSAVAKQNEKPGALGEELLATATQRYGAGAAATLLGLRGSIISELTSSGTPSRDAARLADEILAPARQAVVGTPAQYDELIEKMEDGFRKFQKAGKGWNSREGQEQMMELARFVGERLRNDAAKVMHENELRQLIVTELAAANQRDRKDGTIRSDNIDRVATEVARHVRAAGVVQPN